MTSNTNSTLHYDLKKCFDRIHHTDEILSSSFFNDQITFDSYFTILWNEPVSI